MYPTSNRRWTEFNVTQNCNHQCIHWAAKHSHCIVLDSCNNDVYGPVEFDLLIAVGVNQAVECKAGNAFTRLQDFLDNANDWVFGYFGYDLKNETEKLTSKQPDRLGFEDMVFFVPEVILMLRGNTLSVGTVKENAELIFADINSISVQDNFFGNSIQLQHRVAKEDYLSVVHTIREHIRNGDVYEMNYCFELFAEHVTINPVDIFNKLTAHSAAPFSGLMQWEDVSIISASPERFLKKMNSKIISQPIKGTIRRGNNNAEDTLLREILQHSEKDRAENVMIADLVRNDLTRFAITGSVNVDQLFGIYSFRHVHQMVSTISARLRPEVALTDVIKNAFPMGSMTGAPKIMAMELIDKYESSRRGPYSGSLGYFSPEGNFDFNVLIRSIFYNRKNEYVSVQVGSAITWDSDPEQEYAECMLKADALQRILQ